MYSTPKFVELLTCFEQNKDKDWFEWLEFNEVLPQKGKQGIVGKLNVKNKSLTCIFKISQHINYLVEHEHCILHGLKELSFCPHFCKLIGMLPCITIQSFSKQPNPFLILPNSRQIQNNFLLMEYIEDSYKLYNYIRSDKISDIIIMSLLKQILCAIIIAQNKKKFTHYDLHSYNIMIKKCDKNIVFLYVISEEVQYAIPTYGYYPIIIDFGFSYINDMDDNPLFATLAHTNIGFMSNTFDWLADPKLFLISVSHDLYKKRKNSTLCSKFTQIIKRIFKPLSVDWLTGWDETDSDNQSASDAVINSLQTHNEISNLFNNYSTYCFDLIQSLIVLPLEKQSVVDVDIYFKTFLTEFVKIENEIGSTYYNLYLLKIIINCARDIRHLYYDLESRPTVVLFFSNYIQEQIQKLVKFCLPKKVKYERMLCSLYLFSKGTEGILFSIINNQMIEKQKHIDNMSVSSVVDIFNIIDSTIVTPYCYTNTTTVSVINSITTSSISYRIPSTLIDTIQGNCFENGRILYKYL